MKCARRACLLSCAALIAALAIAATGEAKNPGGSRVTIESLLREMVDMQRLATAPEPGIKCAQQSSYDRASVAPDKPGWFANGDAGQFIRQERRDGRTEHVMAEMKGPGAIVRLWSANPDGGGTIRIYIDDLSRPALEADFLALTSAQMPEFPAPFSGRRAMGANLYFPIPYQQRCKVTVERPNLYYHVGYRTYPAGTQVEPFSMASLPSLRPTMAEVGRILEHPAARFPTDGAQRRATDAAIAPGEEVTLYHTQGPAAIVRLEIKPSVPREHLVAAMREALLVMHFDDERDPCVWAPLGDFFGSTPGLNAYESLPVGMQYNTNSYCNWYMPFAKRARIAVRNESGHPINLRLVIWSKPAVWQKAKSLYFHAKWRSEWLPEEPQFVDWPMLQAQGRGRLVGVMLGVFNPRGGWWGEGDEKIWGDDDAFPSYIGTGSEDYFGYAWGHTALFSHAYHNQSICTGPGHAGYTAVARYHILDDIPFQKSIRFYIEKWDVHEREYACTTYWYAAPGSTDFFKPIPVEKRRVRPMPEPFRVKGAFEGEGLAVARCTGGRTLVQDMSPDFSGSKHLWWVDLQPGAILELNVPVNKPGRCKITLGLTKSWDYGIHQPLINGNPAGQPVDLYAPKVTPLKVELGDHELSAGEVRIGLQCVGTNPSARPARYMAGIDYILLEPLS